MHIQIGHIFKQSFKNVWDHKLEWFRVAFAPLVILALGVLFMSLIFWLVGYPLAFHEAILGQQSLIDMNQLSPINVMISGDLAKFIYEVAYWVAFISLTINGLRYGVLEEGGNDWWTFHFNKRFWKTLLYMFLYMLFFGMYIGIGVAIVLGAHVFFTNIALDIVLGTLFALYAFYVVIRISLYQLLIAIDITHPIRTSWHLLKGNLLRFLGLFLLITLALLGIMIVGGVLVGILGGLLGLISPVLIKILIVFLGVFAVLVSWAVFAKAYALVYQTLKQERAA